MTRDEFEHFDRTLNDFRNDVSKAHVTMRDAVARYIDMMDALDIAFTLYYGYMPSEEQTMLKGAFNKLADTVATWTEENKQSSDNVQVLKPPKT